MTGDVVALHGGRQAVTELTAALGVAAAARFADGLVGLTRQMGDLGPMLTNVQNGLAEITTAEQRLRLADAVRSRQSAPRRPSR